VKVDWLLDASAVLALLQSEPGSEQVKVALPKSAITSVNACEVLGVLVRHGCSPAEAALIFDKLHIPVLAFTYPQAQSAASLLLLKPSRPLSLGDRACLGAAVETKRRVLTAERSWSELDLGDIRIKSIR
jgi:PIN domain nuclease of toxin-antitoxin system